jgi:hypothetical protein
VLEKRPIKLNYIITIWSNDGVKQNISMDLDGDDAEKKGKNLWRKHCNQ